MNLLEFEASKLAYKICSVLLYFEVVMDISGFLELDPASDAPYVVFIYRLSAGTR